ncbi:MAG: class I SAM-dependent methyltransferase [Cyclobacteriaceae bacterium]|jgi:ubiquinone/menaquinone biosynthesis C-methylase UbiE
MIGEYHKIKDGCRIGLIKYLEKAFSAIPEMDNPNILDIGCGTGVPTLWIANKYTGTITAIDIDPLSLDWLQKKINTGNLRKRLTILNISFFNFKAESNSFDIILAEGFLNVVGFEKGFKKVIKLLKRNGYLIVHDEFKDHDKKCDFIRQNHCRIVDSVYLDEGVWWNDYYKRLLAEIHNKENSKIHSFFKSDIKEIECYKADPSAFRSIYYIIEK